MTSNRSDKLLLYQNFLAVLTFTFTFTSSRPGGALAPKKIPLTITYSYRGEGGPDYAHRLRTSTLKISGKILTHSKKN